MLRSFRRPMRGIGEAPVFESTSHSYFRFISVY
jgi:hypothetical protein